MAEINDEDYIEGLTSEQRDELVAAGAITVSHHNGVPYVFRCPDEKEWFNCFNEMENPKKSTAMAQKALVIRCALHPSRESVVELVEKRPPIVQRFFGDVISASGLDDSVSAKKL